MQNSYSKLKSELSKLAGIEKIEHHLTRTHHRVTVFTRDISSALRVISTVNKVMPSAQAWLAPINNAIVLITWSRLYPGGSCNRRLNH